MARFNKTIRLTSLLVLIAFTTVFAPAANAQRKEKGEKLVREIFVPYANLDALLNSQTQRVFLTREEYADLLARAVEQKKNEAPRDYTVLSAVYRGQIEEGRATILGEIEIESLRDELLAAPLRFAGVGIRRAVLDGKSAALAPSGANQVTVFVQGKGRHKLQLELTTRLETSAAQQSLKIELPRAPASQLKLRAPGNVDVKSGAEVLQRSVEQDANVTDFDLLVKPGPMHVVLSLNNRLRRNEQVVLARSVLIDELTEAYERIHSTTSFEILHGAVDQFRFATPDGWEITDVRTELLSKWSIVKENEQTILEISLRRPATGIVTCNIAATRTGAKLDAWQLPKLSPLDVAGQVSVVGLLAESRLKPVTVETEGLIPIDIGVLTEALPESVLKVEPGQVSVRPTFAFYAPQGDFSLRGVLEKPTARLKLLTNLVLTVDERGLRARGGFVLLPEIEKRFSIEITPPENWRITSTVDEKGSSLRFETFGEGAERRTFIQLPAGVAPGAEKTVVFQAEQIPEGWFDDWDAKQIEFPVFQVANSDEELGAIAVQPGSDYTVLPVELQRLIPLDENEKVKFRLDGVGSQLAYRFEQRPYKATLSVGRKQPWITSRSFCFYTVESNRLRTHYEIVFDVQDAGVKKLSFRLPASTPKAVSISGLNGVNVKEFHSDEADDERRRTALLSERREGEVRLSVDLESSWEGDPPEELDLPVVVTDGTRYQTGVVAVEGDPEFDIQINTESRSVDVGELIVAKHQPGRRVLGAHEYVGDAGAFQLAIARRTSRALPAVLIQRAELVTQIGVNGRSQSAVRFSLVTNSAFLEVRMPAAAKLWSTLLDGKPMTPQRDDDHLLLSLPPDERKIRDLRLIYEAPTEPIRGMGFVRVEPPKLYIRSEQGDARVMAPLADLKWHVILPKAHRVIRSDGAVYLEDPPLRPTPLQQIANWFRSSLRQMTRHNRSYKGRSFPAAATPSDEELSMPEGEEADMTTWDDAKEDAPETPGEAAANAEPSKVARPAPVQPATDPAGAKTAEPNAPNTPGFTTKPSAGKPPVVQAPARGEEHWALEGVRSLTIDFDEAFQRSDPAERVSFQSLGVDPLLRIDVLSRQRLDSIAGGLFLVVLAIGVGLTRRSVAVKTGYLLAVTAFSLLLPLATGAIELLGPCADQMFFAACWLVPYYLAVGAIRLIVAAVRSGNGNTVAAGATAATLAICLMAPAANGQDKGDINKLLRLLQQSEQLAIPKDAIIIPYQLKEDDDEAAVKKSIREAKKVFVPYSKYVELWNLANPDARLTTVKPPAKFALAGASFEVELSEGEDLLIRGRLDVDQYVDGVVEVPLPLSGGVFTEARVDGDPALLRVVAANPPAQGKGQQPNAGPAGANSSLVVLQLTGKGRKKLDVAIRMRLTRQGGWRIAAGRLPAAPSSALSIRVPQAQTEVRLDGRIDRDTFESEEAGDTIETAVGMDGRFQIQWRPKVAEAEVDQSLTANSRAVLDIQEDGLRLTWRVNLKFRRSRRDTFSFLLPGDYLVEKIAGDNVRGWKSDKQDDGRLRVDVTLLNGALESESLTLRLSKRGSIGNGDLMKFDAPVVTVAEAVLHQGDLTIRRSPLLDVESGDTRGVSQTDIDPNLAKLVDKRDAGPLGVQDFQAYRFATTPFTVPLTVSPVKLKTADSMVQTQTVLKLSASDATMESRLLITSPKRPIHHVVVEIPANLELDQVAAPSIVEWSVAERNGRRELHVFLSQGQQGGFTVLLAGSLGARGPDDPVTAPVLNVQNIDSQEGEIVVRVDPGFNVAVAESEGIRATPLGGAASGARQIAWLAAAQRTLARLLLTYTSPDYKVVLSTTPRQPKVTCSTVTNVRVSDQTIEETVLLQFSVRNAGVRELSFLLPVSMRDARVNAMMLRRKQVEDVEGDASRIRVRLQLQEEVMDDIRVIVEHNRLHTTEEHQAPVPKIEPAVAETLQQYITLQNASRDELVVNRQEGVEPFGRRTTPPLLAGADLARAFVVRAEPDFAVQTKRRSTVKTAGGRIVLAETRLIIDENGAFRGSQMYRIDNRTEQFLEIKLPESAELWTAQVAGEPVKPSQSPGAANQVRLPLVKTAPGDRDYEVLLKYGGRLQPLANWKRVSFPFISSVNIDAELSQVRLMLPQSYRWMPFDGSMRRVLDQAEMEAGYAQYLTRQIESAMETLSIGSDYDQARAVANLKQLSAESQSFYESNAGFSNSELRTQLDLNSKAIERAERQIDEVVRKDGEQVEFDNRARFNDVFEQQRNKRSRNVVNDAGGNFRFREEAQGDKRSDKDNVTASFDRAWLRRNQLGQNAAKDDTKKGAKREGGRVLGPTTRQTVQLKEKIETFSDKIRKQPTDAKPQAATASRRGQTESNRSLARKYQKRLEAANEVRQQSSSPNQPGSGSGPVPPPGTPAPPGGGGFGGGMGGLGDVAGERVVLQDGTVRFDTVSGGELASLDIELPVRGVEFLFTTVRGELEVTSQPVASSTVHRAIHGGIAVGLLLLCVVGIRVVRRIAAIVRS